MLWKWCLGLPRLSHKETCNWLCPWKHFLGILSCLATNPTTPRLPRCEEPSKGEGDGRKRKRERPRTPCVKHMSEETMLAMDPSVPVDTRYTKNKPPSWSPSWIVKTQKLWAKYNACFTPLSFGVVCYTLTDNQNILRHLRATPASSPFLFVIPWPKDTLFLPLYLYIFWLSGQESPSPGVLLWLLISSVVCLVKVFPRTLCFAVLCASLIGFYCHVLTPKGTD